MIERVLIAELSGRADGPVSVSGWVEKVRDQRYVQFVVLRDESGAVQLVNGGVVRDEPAQDADPQDTARYQRTRAISEVAHGSFVTVTGELQHNERVKLGGVEIQIDNFEVLSAADPETPVKPDSAIDVRMDWRFLDLRRPEQALIFKVQTTFEHALREVWINRGFIEVHTPKLMASASESRAELFSLDYFDTTAILHRARSCLNRWRRHQASAVFLRSAPLSGRIRLSHRVTPQSSPLLTASSAGSSLTKMLCSCTRS